MICLSIYLLDACHYIHLLKLPEPSYEFLKKSRDFFDRSIMSRSTAISSSHQGLYKSAVMNFTVIPCTCFFNPFHLITTRTNNNSYSPSTISHTLTCTGLYLQLSAFILMLAPGLVFSSTKMCSLKMCSPEIYRLAPKASDSVTIILCFKISFF